MSNRPADLTAVSQIKDPVRRHAALATVDPRAAAERFVELDRRHERLKGGVMDALDALDRGHARAVNVRLREALYAEACRREAA